MQWLRVAASICGGMLGYCVERLPVCLVLPSHRWSRKSVATQDGVAYVRKWVVCPIHNKCKKFRNCHSKQTSSFGALEVVGYLGLWLRSGGGFDCAADHVHSWRAPSESQIREYLESLGML